MGYGWRCAKALISLNNKRDVKATWGSSFKIWLKMLIKIPFYNLPTTRTRNMLLMVKSKPRRKIYLVLPIKIYIFANSDVRCVSNEQVWAFGSECGWGVVGFNLQIRELAKMFAYFLVWAIFINFGEFQGQICCKKGRMIQKQAWIHIYGGFWKFLKILGRVLVLLGLVVEW